MTLKIRAADLDDGAVRELVRFHHADMHAMSPPELAFVFDIEKLRAPGIRVLAAYEGEELLGIGAVAIRGDEAELKSMRTAPDRVRGGVGTALLEALVGIAGDAGIQTVRLETGSGPGFEPAWQLYLRHGFTPCGPFGDYRASPFNRYMMKRLAGAEVVSLSRSSAHTFSKQPSASLDLIAGEGVAGDAHSGTTVKHRSRVAIDPTQPNLRQVHLIAAELLDELNAQGFDLAPGSFGENMLTRGLDLLALPRGTRFRIGGEAELELTGLRNPCGQIEAFRPGLLARVALKANDGAVVRRAGVMAVVVTGGRVSNGDGIVVALPSLPHQALDRV